jgi:EAL domain-containing protein (putative c-di-GMP-specific phosphodiesterase class I)
MLPASFIPVAEESSLILDIGDWVLETSCSQLAAWSRDARMCRMTLAFNVSAHQFRNGDFVEQVGAALHRHGVEPSRLRLEVAERAVLSDLDEVAARMQALKGLGVQLSLDDFGTGYSSLSCLKRLPLDQIKIDHGFVRDVTSDPASAVMVQTITDMARNFGLETIAEGVETEAQLAFLKHHGCMAYQGWFFGKPVSAEGLQALLEKLA